MSLRKRVPKPIAQQNNSKPENEKGTKRSAGEYQEAEAHAHGMAPIKKKRKRVALNSTVDGFVLLFSLVQNNVCTCFSCIFC